MIGYSLPERKTPRFHRILLAGWNVYQSTHRVDSYCIETGTWTRLADLPSRKYRYPGGGGCPSMLYMPAGNKIVWASQRPEGPFPFPPDDHLAIYDIGADTWTFRNYYQHTFGIGSISPTSRGRIILPCGDPGYDMDIYDPVSDSFFTSTAGLPGYVSDCVQVTLADGRVLVWSQFDLTTMLFTDDGAHGSWAWPAFQPPDHNDFFGMVRLLDGRLMLFGGYYYATTVHLTTPAIDLAWAADATASPNLSRMGACVLPDGRVVFAGLGSGASVKVYVYTPGAWAPGDVPNLNAGSWVTSAPSLPLTMVWPSVIYSSATGLVYIFGKIDNDIVNGVFSYNVATDTITAIATPTVEQQSTASCLYIA
jgi:hypothetical protein